MTARPNHYAVEAEGRPVPVCPGCGFRAIETRTRYGLRCSCPRCKLWSWDRHPLVDAETHAARNAAHAAFDKLWRGGPLKRGRAYKALAAKLGISRRRCHIKIMDKNVAGRVPAAVAEIWRDIGAEDNASPM